MLADDLWRQNGKVYLIIFRIPTTRIQQLQCLEKVNICNSASKNMKSLVAIINLLKMGEFWEFSAYYNFTVI